MRGNSHARCGVGENLEIISKSYLSLFQDTNLQQMAILKYLKACPTCQSMMVVGDDSQSIFSFRNTSPEYILNFGKYLEDEFDDMYLLENHRCTPEIISFANRVNEMNIYRVPKDLVATRPSGKPVVVKGFITTQEEEEYIIEGVKSQLAAGRKPEEIAIICSTKSELRKYADKLTREGIPSVSLNPESFSENCRVQGALSFIRCLRDNAREPLDLLVYANAKTKGQVMEHPEKMQEFQDMATSDLDEVLAVEDEAARKDALIQKLTEMDQSDDELYQKFVETLNRKSKLEEVQEYCLNFELMGDVSEAKRQRNYPGVVLTTAHSSKGLEWPVVYASISKFDTEKKQFHDAKLGSVSKLEEQRRLLFVVATRARDELYITGKFVAYGAKGRYIYNRFLEDAYSANDQEFSVWDIEAEMEARAEERRQKRKAAAAALESVAELGK